MTQDLDVEPLTWKGYSNPQFGWFDFCRPVVNGSLVDEGRPPDLTSRMSASHDGRRRPTLPVSSSGNLLINGLIRDVRRRPDLTLRMPEETRQAQEASFASVLFG
jgi:hypothetical protein